MQRIKIPEPMSGGLILSYKCNAECRHCMYACSPKWDGEISNDDLEIILNQLAGIIKPSPYGVKFVSLNHGLHFTGGEPFLNYELLLKAVRLANRMNIPSTFVETNCYWCTDDKITLEKLETLKENGLKGIMISVNPFYLEYVPFERTERAIRIALRVFGENMMIYQLDYYFRFKSLDLKGKISVEDYLKAEKDDLAGNVEMFLMGRAAYRLAPLYLKYPASYFLNQPCMPPLLRNWHNHFDNYGNYLPGYCGGISLGNWRNLDELLQQGIDVEKHPILNFLARQDFTGLLRFATDFGYRESEIGYISKCHLCVDIRKHLAEKKEFEELSPYEFYIHLE